jgi:CelD/BcsL family acetyltransferase involved in cellulose biosynthesis
MIEKIESAEAFRKLSAEWKELLNASPANCLFLTWEWLFTWWKHLAEGRKLSLLTLRRGRELLAIAPLALGPRELKSFSPFRSLEFLGTGIIGSDYLDLIMKREREKEGLQEMAEYLAGANRTIKLDHVNRKSCLAAELARRLKELGWGMCEAKSNVSPFIDLSGHSWESYLATLGSEHRYNFKRRLKNLMKRFDVRFEPARTEGERRKALAALIGLHTMRWQNYGNRGAFHSPAVLSFHEEMSRIALERDWLRLYVLWLGEKPAAAFYGFRYQGVFYFYQSGFDPGLSKLSVGMVSLGLAIQSALEEGAEEFDFLYGDEPYKFLWARQARELGWMEIYPPGMAGMLHKQSLEWNRAARRMARQMLQQPRPVSG